MGKSRAEIQKAYRERLKEKNKDEYLRKERERKNRSYVPSSQLSDNDRDRRNKRNRETLRRFYQRKKDQRNVAHRDQDTSGYESTENHEGLPDGRGRAQIRFNFQRGNGRRTGALKRWKRDISDAKSRIRLLEQERNRLFTKVKTTQKAYQRLKSKLDNRKLESTDLTPRKNTEKIMKDANLTDEQMQRIRVPLLLGNAITAEIRESRKNTKKGQKKTIHRVVSGQILKKYKCIRSVAARTGLCRHALSESNDKDIRMRPVVRYDKAKRYREKIETFLKREDNSRTMPGKHDAKSVKKGEKFQAHVLVDYLENLYKKFMAENPSLKLSLATFCRCRPVYILKASFTSRLSCLCTKHQNAALTVKAIRKAGVDINSNPEKVIKDKIDFEKIKSDIGDEITLSQWTRVEIEEKGKKKQVTIIVEQVLTKEKFIEHIVSQMNEFELHVDRMKTQYEQIRFLKNNLPNDDIIMQLDFAENYSCRSLEEVQSAYFNQTSVTLHPIVVYFNDDSSDLKHKSYVIVSDEMTHKASTVMAFLDEIIPEVQKLKPKLNTIHYWSDSPSSQYRNKYIFNMISNHLETYNINAVWNYFESGHGKGPCDGLGGSCKRLADEAIRCGKYVIQDANSFFDWAQTSNMKNVCFRFVSANKCFEKSQFVSQLSLKAVTGTMKVHAVKGLGNGEVMVRNVSCYCNGCISRNPCNTWTFAMTTKQQSKNQNGEIAEINDNDNSRTNQPNSENCLDNDYKVGDFVAAIYDQKWYLGQIMDEDQSEYQINFMESKKCLYQWPRQKDIIWLCKSKVLCKVDAPSATGKSKRMFKLDDLIVQKVNKEFNSK